MIHYLPDTNNQIKILKIVNIKLYKRVTFKQGRDLKFSQLNFQVSQSSLGISFLGLPKNKATKYILYIHSST